MTFEMLCNPRAHAAAIEFYMDAGLAANAGYMNIETLQKMMWEALEVPVAIVPRVMFTVRAEGDPCKWSPGEEHASFASYGLKIKYPDELQGVRATCALAGGGGDVDAKLQTLYGYWSVRERSVRASGFLAAVQSVARQMCRPDINPLSLSLSTAPARTPTQTGAR